MTVWIQTLIMTHCFFIDFSNMFRIITDIAQGKVMFLVMFVGLSVHSGIGVYFSVMHYYRQKGRLPPSDLTDQVRRRPH